MELRRAILLFAIVLALAAAVTALTSGARRENDRAAEPATRQPSLPTASAGTTEPGVATVRIDASRAPIERSITAGRATTLAVSTDEAGTVTIAALGLTENAEPGSPALLDLLQEEPSADPLTVEFMRAGDEGTRTIARLDVRPSR